VFRSLGTGKFPERLHLATVRARLVPVDDLRLLASALDFTLAVLAPRAKAIGVRRGTMKVLGALRRAAPFALLARDRDAARSDCRTHRLVA